MVETKKEEEVRKALTEQFLTPKQIANRRKTSVQVVYKTIKKLKEKGILRGSMDTPYHSFNPPSNFKPSLRLHGQQFSVTLSLPSRHRGLTFLLEGVKVKVFNRSIQIWSKHKDFSGSTTEEVLKQSMAYWHTFFLRLEERLKVFFYSQNKGEIRQVAAHYEEQDSETGKHCSKKGERLQIRSTKDGMVWLTTDKSFRLENTEALHPKTAYEDSQLVFDDIFNSWRDGKAFTPREATDAIGRLATLQAQSQERLHVEIITHLALMRQEIKDFKRNPRKKPDIQEGLGRWL